jgi:5-methylcytosine-specific restriction protein A
LNIKNQCAIIIIAKYREPLRETVAAFVMQGGTAMPRKPKKPCGHSGCPNLTDGYYCEQHRKEHAIDYNTFRRDPSTDKRYGGEWKRISRAYRKAHPLCELCLANEQLVPAVLVHHKNPIKISGDNNWGNLQSLCQHHHSQIHMTENNEVRNGRKKSTDRSG